MAITKEQVIARVEIVGEYKAVQVATDTLIKEDGVIISKSRHRKTLTPDLDISSEDAEVQSICNSVWTQAVRDAWESHKASFSATE